MLAFNHPAREPVVVRVEVGLARLTEAHFDLAVVLEKPTLASTGASVTKAAAVADNPSEPQRHVPASQDVHSGLSRDEQSAPGWAWATLIAGGVGVGIAGGLELLRGDAESDAEHARVQLDKQAALDRMDHAMWGARIAGAAGAAFLLTSGILWWRDAQAAPETATAKATASITPIVTPSHAGLELTIVGDAW
jgi:hypothetical protein